MKNFIVTASTANYFRSFQQLLYTFQHSKNSQYSHFIFYDIGLNKKQVTFFQNILLERYENLEFRSFDFEQHPDFVNPQYNTYSWKPIIIHDVLEEKKGNVLWLDSANLILRNLQPVWNEIDKEGSYVPFSGAGSLEEWTVKETLEFLNVSRDHYTKRNRAGNTCGFSYQNAYIRELVNKWKNLALIRECIRPETASRSNHRDDQSLLTILLTEQEKTGKIILTQDEVDISSAHPLKYISVRKNLDKLPFLPIGYWAMKYFLIKRKLDILFNKIHTSK